MRIARHITRGAAAGSIATLAVVVGGLGIAAASNGGSLTLGHHNSATKTTTLTDKKGTPLSLVGKKSKPPLTVNSSTLVKHLNAAELGGLTGGQLSTGSAASHQVDLTPAITGGSIAVLSLPTATGSGTPHFVPVQAAQTAPLAAGVYYVSANAFGEGLEGALCFIGTANTFPSGAYQFGSIPADNVLASTVETEVIHVNRNQRISEWCLNVDTTSGDDPAKLVSYGITALRVDQNHPGIATAPNASTGRRTASQMLKK